jgi:L-threonylcarbamoyladenylate synthase
MILSEKELQESTGTSTAAVRAAELLRAGKLVAFPTETVYGLGADAENERAVRRIFELKGRPVAHPLIVHIASSADLERWGRELPAATRRLADRFWPGPLTIILQRGPRIPPVVTGGLDTVGLRVPDHPVALGMLKAFGGAVAAPSANRFGRVSPTRAEHVRQDLGSDVDFILDGGPCTVGIESTIVDLSSDEPAILRPGAVTHEQLESVLDRPVQRRVGGSVRSPGQHDLHYAPRAEVVLVEVDKIPERAIKFLAAGRRVVVLGNRPAKLEANDLAFMPLPCSAEEAARSLYHTLREVDRLGFDVALVTLPNETGIGSALVDRLRRAAGPRLVGETEKWRGEK